MNVTLGQAAKMIGQLGLSAGAFLGLLVVAAGVVAPLLGVHPVVITSGSMEPAISTGSITLTREVDAADVRVGDVVMVTTATGSRVTHRVVSVVSDDGKVALSLKGDANSVPDPETYYVSNVHRVLLDVPWVGHLLSNLRTPPGLLGLGGLGIFLIFLIVRGDGRSTDAGTGGAASAAGAGPAGGRRKAETGSRSTFGAGVIVIAVAVGALDGSTVQSRAAWTDAVEISATASALQVASPQALPTSTNCVANNGVTSSSITFRWSGVSAPSHSSYEYVLRFFTRSNSQQSGADVLQAHSGTVGAQQSATYSSSLLGGLLGLNLVSSTNLRLEIRARLVGQPWFGQTVVSIDFRSGAFLGIVNFSCNQ